MQEGSSTLRANAMGRENVVFMDASVKIDELGMGREKSLFYRWTHLHCRRAKYVLRMLTTTTCNLAGRDWRFCWRTHRRTHPGVEGKPGRMQTERLK